MLIFWHAHCSMESTFLSFADSLLQPKRPASPSGPFCYVQSRQDHMQDKFLASEYPQSAPEQAGFHIIPVPLEQAALYGGGTASGPQALLAASHQLEAPGMRLHAGRIWFLPPRLWTALAPSPTRLTVSRPLWPMPSPARQCPWCWAASIP